MAADGQILKKVKKGNSSYLKTFVMHELNSFYMMRYFD